MPDPEGSSAEILKLFSKADLAEIEAAVRAAEQRTSGEIVPFIAGSSDFYAHAIWKGAAFGAMSATLAAAGFLEIGMFWGDAPPLWIAATAAAGAGIGYLLTAFIPPLKRFLTPADTVERRVKQRAQAGFLEQEIFRTKERPGILIFVSSFERRVFLLADTGVTAKVPQEEWDRIVAQITAGIRGGAPGKSMAAAILACGDLLARHGLARRPDDQNELPDQAKIRGK